MIELAVMAILVGARTLAIVIVGLVIARKAMASKDSDSDNDKTSPENEQATPTNPDPDHDNDNDLITAPPGQPTNPGQPTQGPPGPGVGQNPGFVPPNLPGPPPPCHGPNCPPGPPPPCHGPNCPRPSCPPGFHLRDHTCTKNIVINIHKHTTSSGGSQFYIV